MEGDKTAATDVPERRPPSARRTRAASKGAEDGPPPNNEGDERKRSTAARSCRSCEEALFCIRDHVQLKPCGCVLCPKCLLEAHARRGSRAIVCRACKATVESHEYVAALENNEGAGYEYLEEQKAWLEAQAERLRVRIEVQKAAYAPLSDDEEEGSAADEDGDYRPGAPSRPPPRKKQRYSAEDRCAQRGCSCKAQSGGLCIKHGGKFPKKTCVVEGCKNLRAGKGGVCVRHGAPSRLPCQVDGCTNQRANAGVCIRHGAKRRQCKMDGCTNHPKKDGLCKRHARRVPCRIEGCRNKVVRDNLCKRHGAPQRRCGQTGCKNLVVNQGVCIRHGARAWGKRARGSEAKNGPASSEGDEGEGPFVTSQTI